MNIVDIIIILLLILGAVIGFKQGAIQRITSFIGLIVIVIVAFMYKNDLSILLYENLPFFDFWGPFKGIQVLNIVLYEVIAFFVILGGLYFLLQVLIVITGLVEKLLKATIFLALPSKILGIFVGLVEYYIYIFVVLYILSLPMLNLDLLNESKGADIILNHSPVLSSLAEDTTELYSEVYEIIDNRENKTSEEINEEVLEFMLQNKFITYENAKELIDKNKVIINDKTMIENYK